MNLLFPSCLFLRCKYGSWQTVVETCFELSAAVLLLSEMSASSWGNNVVVQGGKEHACTVGCLDLQIVALGWE